MLAQVPVGQREALLLVETPVVRGVAHICRVSVRQNREPRQLGRTRVTQPLAVAYGEEPASGPTFNSALQDLWVLDTSPTILPILRLVFQERCYCPNVVIQAQSLPVPVSGPKRLPRTIVVGHQRW